MKAVAPLGCDGLEDVTHPLLFLDGWPPWPHRRRLFDQAPSEDRQRGGGVVLQVEPLRVPPLIGSRQLARHVLGCPLPQEVDARASHQHQDLLASVLLPVQGDGEEVPPQLEVRLDPQVPLAHRDEGRDVLDPVGVEVLQLNLVVVQQPQEERMRGISIPRSWKGAKETM